ncbi:hypothetical protein E2320_017990 [Naja naja]|nr:hypothetical protein E2320_017990 [Naja naja]
MEYALMLGVKDRKRKKPKGASKVGQKKVTTPVAIDTLVRLEGRHISVLPAPKSGTVYPLKIRATFKRSGVINLLGLNRRYKLHQFPFSKVKSPINRSSKASITGNLVNGAKQDPMKKTFQEWGKRGDQIEESHG